MEILMFLIHTRLAFIAVVYAVIVPYGYGQIRWQREADRMGVPSLVQPLNRDTD